jgi:hypothetical protein
MDGQFGGALEYGRLGEYATGNETLINPKLNERIKGKAARLEFPLGLLRFGLIPFDDGPLLRMQQNVSKRMKDEDPETVGAEVNIFQ